jgi:hypothetical protein
LAPGDSFGEWVVLTNPFSTNRKDGKGTRLSVSVKCSCGNESIVLVRNLVKGSSTKCKECAYGALGAYPRAGEIAGHYMTRLVTNALNRNIQVLVSTEDLNKKWLEQDRKCALTGWSLTVALRDSDVVHATASVDRIDSSLPYTPDNIQWVHKEVNRMKNMFCEDRFIEVCRAVSDFADGKWLN